MAKNAVPEDFCQLCGQETDVLCSGHRKGKEPYADGKNYNVLCDICFWFIKTWQYDEKQQKLVFFSHTEKNMYTVEEMVKEGYLKEKVKISYKAVKNALKKK